MFNLTHQSENVNLKEKWYPNGIKNGKGVPSYTLVEIGVAATLLKTVYVIIQVWTAGKRTSGLCLQIVSVPFGLCQFQEFSQWRENKIPLSLCVRSIIDTILPLKKTPTTAKHIYLGEHGKVSLSLKSRLSMFKQHLWDVRLCNTDAHT